MSLDLAKLQKVRTSNGKTIAQCPACVEDGGDSKGEHLVIFPEGEYGCVANAADREHSKRIWQLSGTSHVMAHSANPLKFEVRPYQMPERRLIQGIKRFDNALASITLESASNK